MKGFDRLSVQKKIRLSTGEIIALLSSSLIE
jgi:hypothetical protein